MKFRSLFALLIFGPTLSAQQSTYNFVSDSSKPYVYLKFDHIGPRTPLRDGEGDTGLWLRIVNNCRVPILVPSSNSVRDPKGIEVFDEIIERKGTPWITTTVDPEGSAPASKEKYELPPYGYSEEIYSLARIDPGKELLFSVPLSHVSGHWFMRIEVYLGVSEPKAGSGPPTVLDFSKGAIPYGAWPDSTAGQLPPNGDAVHESGHVIKKTKTRGGV